MKRHFYVRQDPTPLHGKTLKAALRLATIIVNELPAVPDEDSVAEVRVLTEIARTLVHRMPKVTLWCVVKHYHDYDPKTGAWAPAVWTAHLTKKHAEAFCRAIAEHYNAEAVRMGWKTDRWLVERRPARPTEIIDPGLTPAEYVAGLNQ